MTYRSIPTAPGRSLPAPIAALDRLSHNMYWAWNPTIRQVLRSVDPAKFDAGMSPVQMLVEADLDEVVAGPERAELLGHVLKTDHGSSSGIAILT